MRFLKTNSATIVTVGPFYDKTDGVTIETALTITNERISFTVDANDGSAPTLVLDNVTGATSGTSNDLNYITNNDAGLMQLELSAANTNYLGRAFLTITDAANHCPVFHEFTILPALVYDSIIAGTDNLQVDTIQVGGTSQTARDIGASVLLSSGSGTGQVTLTSGRVNADVTHIATAAVSTSTAQLGVNVVNAAGTAWGSGAITAASVAASALNGKGDWTVGKTGYTLTATTGLGNQTADITGNLSGSVGSVTGAVGSVTGAVGSVTGAVGSVTGAVGSVTGNVGGSVASVAANGITATSLATDAINAASVKADAVTKIQTGLATPTNITAGTITTVTNLTNAPTAGDLTTTMKTSVTTAATAATPTAAAVTGAVGSVTGNVGGNVTGSVGSIATGGITTASFAAGAIDAAAIAANAIGASELATDAAEEIADAILGRNVAGGSNTGRLVKEALYPLRNKVVVSGGTMTVYQTDDSTSSWTASVSGTSGADPITTIDPA
jgi:hypothetical protein